MTHEENESLENHTGKIAALIVTIIVGVPVVYVWAGLLAGTVVGVLALPLVVGLGYGLFRAARAGGEHG